MKEILVLIGLLMSFGILLADDSNCITCHMKKQPNIVADWEISKHSANDVTCATCHGEATYQHGRCCLCPNSHP